VAAFGKLDGFYQRLQGLQRRYSYRAIYGTTNGTIEWKASVFFDNQVKGNPGGLINKPDEVTDIHELVKRAVEISIEDLLEVQE
jgi:hypothetical protein